MNRLPTPRPICGRVSNRPVSTKDTAIMIGKSNVRKREATGIGAIRAVTPRIPRTLKMLDPTILPIAISDWRRNAAVSEVASSGRDVPTATMVRPINASDTSKSRATDTAPSTKNRAPNNSAARPNPIHSSEITTDPGAADLSLSVVSWPGFRKVQTK